MVIAANDLPHAHVFVIYHAAQVVGGRSVGPQQHQVVELRIEIADVAMQPIPDHDLFAVRATKANDRLDPDRRRPRVVAPPPIVARNLAPRALLLAHGGQLVRRAIAVVGGTRLKQLIGHFPMPLHTRGLQQRLFVRTQPEALQRLYQRSDVLRQ